MLYSTMVRTGFFALLFLLCYTGMQASNWKNGGLAQGHYAGMAAQSDGSYILGLAYPTETPLVQLQFVRYTPSTRQFEPALTISTTGSVIAISKNGHVALYDSGKFSILRLSDSRIIDAFAFGSMTSRYETSSFSADGNSLAVVYSSTHQNNDYNCLRRDITAGLSDYLELKTSNALPTNNPKFSFSPDGSMVATFTLLTAHHIELWNTTTGDHTVVPIPESNPAYSSLVINNTYAVFTEKNYTPTLVHLATGTTATLNSELLYHPQELADDNTLVSSVYARNFSPHGMLGSNILVQHVESRATLGLFPYSLRSSETISISRAGTTVGLAIIRTSTCPIGTDWINAPQVGAMFYDIPGNRLISVYPDNGHTNGIISTALSPDTRLVASTGNDMHTLWHDTETGTLVGSVQGGGYVAFANDTTLLRGSGLFVDEIDLKTQSVTRRTELKGELTNGFINGLQSSQSGSRIAASASFAIFMLSYPDMEVRDTLVSPYGQYSYFRSMTFTTTGTLVAAFTEASPSPLWVSTAVIAQWDATTGVLLSATIATIPGIISSIELSPDGQTAVFWDAERSILRGYFLSTDGSPIRAVRFGDDNRNKGYYDSEFSSDGSSLYVINREWYMHQGDLLLRQVIRRLAVRDSVAEVLGLSTTSGMASALRILPDHSTAIFGFPTFDGAECYGGILEAVGLRPLATPQVSELSIDFGTVYSGMEVQRSITISPDNDIPLVVQHITIPHTMARYGLTAHYTHSLPDTIQPGEERTIVFTLAPDYPHTAPAYGSIGLAFIGFANVYVAEESINMTAVTIGSKIASDITEITFGDVEVGTTAKRTVVLSPANMATLNISDVYFHGELSDTEQFGLGIDKTLPAALQHNESVAVEVSFTPSMIGTRQVEFVVVSNTTEHSQFVIPISARGVTATHVAEQFPRQTVRISPQPASSLVDISFETDAPGSATIQLFSADGRLLAALPDLVLGAGTHSRTLSVEQLPAGVYFCRITTPAGTTTQPVVVKP